MSVSRSAGHLLAECLVANGVSLTFGVPGESFLPVLDGIAAQGDRLRFIATRHEAGAGNMAVAIAKLTQSAGICFVSRGPGATHASIAVHTAQQDSAPMILFIGQIARADRDRDAFQEVDYARFFGGMAKLVMQIDDADRLPELVARAFAVAESGRPGPVVVVIPEDMLADETSVAALTATKPHAVAPSSDTMATVATALKAAKKPLAIIGRMGWNAQAVADFAAFAERHGLPVATAFRAKDCFDNNHPCYAGELGLGPNPALASRAREADLVLAIGLRLDENTMSGYSLLASPSPKQTVIHVAPSPDVLSLVYQPAHAIIADTRAFNAALNALGALGVNWHAESASASASHAAWTARVEVAEGVNLSHGFTWMTGALPDDAILTNGAGNFAAWLHRYHRHRRFGTQLAPISGAMGFGVPAAVAAALSAPEKTVVCVAGDGDFLMSGQELATAAAYDANLIVIVVDNQAYGTIRMHQEREYPGRVSGTALTSPDFAAYGTAFGFPAWTVSTTDEFAPAFAAAQAAGRGVLHVKTSVNEILPGRRL